MHKVCWWRDVLHIPVIDFRTSRERFGWRLLTLAPCSRVFLKVLFRTTKAVVSSGGDIVQSEADLSVKKVLKEFEVLLLLPKKESVEGSSTIQISKSRQKFLGN